MANILVYVQIESGALHDGSLQCLGKAREIADATGGTVTALALGHSLSDLASPLPSLGADRVLLADHALLADYLPALHEKVLTSVLNDGDYALLLLPGSTSGNDLAPRLAAKRGAACVLDGDALTLENGTLCVKRMEFDRKVLAHYTPGSGLLIATLKDGAADVRAPDATRSGSVEPCALELNEADSPARIVKRDVTAKSVNLKDARIIVAVGAGVGSAENFANVKKLADALGAQLGATRAVVDAGWLPADHQIGQTGAVVRPDLYIGVGISGAVQHWVGMSEAKTIVCINTDKNAPLMKRAHYRIEGDLNVVVPKLLKLLNA